MKIGRTLFGANEPATHEGAEGGIGKLETAKLRQREFASGSREFSEQRLLVRVEFGNSDFRNEDRVANGAARIALDGGSLSRDPFLAQHSLQQFESGSCCRTQFGGACGLAGFQIIQHVVFDVLVFGGLSAAA